MNENNLFFTLIKFNYSSPNMGSDSRKIEMISLIVKISSYKLLASFIMVALGVISSAL